MAFLIEIIIFERSVWYMFDFFVCILLSCGIRTVDIRTVIEGEKRVLGFIEA